MYAESWGPSYATNKGQYRGSDHYLIEYSFGYSNSTNPGSPNPLAAVYQARNDITWPANSAQAFCTSVLGYTTPTVTVTAVVFSTPTSTTTQTVTITNVAIAATQTSFSTTFTTTTTVVNAKRDLSTSSTWTIIKGMTALALPVVPSGTSQAPQKRAIPTPNVLTKYPASIITSACSLAVSPITTTATATNTLTYTANTVVITQTTSTTTTITSTVTIAATTTATNVVTSTKAACTSAYTFVVASGAYVGQYITEGRPDPSVVSYGFVSFTSDATQAARFNFRADGQVQSSDGLYGWVTNSDSIYYILDMTANSQTVYGSVHGFTCSIAGPAPAGVPNAVGVLSCSTDLASSPQTDNNLIQVSGSGYDNSVTLLTLAAVPANTC